MTEAGDVGDTRFTAVGREIVEHHRVARWSVVLALFEFSTQFLSADSVAVPTAQGGAPDGRAVTFRSTEVLRVIDERGDEPGVVPRTKLENPVAGACRCSRAACTPTGVGLVMLTGTLAAPPFRFSVLLAMMPAVVVLVTLGAMLGGDIAAGGRGERVEGEAGRGRPTAGECAPLLTVTTSRRSTPKVPPLLTVTAEPESGAMITAAAVDGRRTGIQRAPSVWVPAGLMMFTRRCLGSCRCSCGGVLAPRIRWPGWRSCFGRTRRGADGIEPLTSGLSVEVSVVLLAVCRCCR